MDGIWVGFVFLEDLLDYVREDIDLLNFVLLGVGESQFESSRESLVGGL